MLAYAPDYERLPLIGKVEAFEYALQNTEGNDLAKVYKNTAANIDTIRLSINLFFKSNLMIISFARCFGWKAELLKFGLLGEQIIQEAWQLWVWYDIF